MIDLLVDGRTLNDRHPGVRHFWLPVLRAWAEQGGRGRVAHRAGEAPEPALLEVGFNAVELPCGARHPLALRRQRETVVASGARATLSPLYLTLAGAPRDVACVFDLIGREYARGVVSRCEWEAAMVRVRRRAAGVVVPSRASERALAGGVPALRGRIRVVSPVAPAAPARGCDVLARLGVASPYALAVASHRPHKQLLELSRAWQARASGLPLVIVGAGTAALEAPPIVRGLGFVGDAELAALLAEARCLVSASRAEGFGLPLLSALAAGVPIVATRLPAHEEVAGESAHWADSPAAVVDRALALVGSTHRDAEGLEAALRRAEGFSRERAATELERALRA